MAPYPRPLANRFWVHVSEGQPPTHQPELGPCWLWTARRDSYGYGVIRRAGRGSLNEKAHRVSWEFACGAIPAGVCVLHRCDTRRCVRPDHLFLGTKGDNARDAIVKGRWPKGERSARAKLSDADVAQVRTLLVAGVFQRDIARRFGVSQVLVSMIRRGHRA